MISQSGHVLHTKAFRRMAHGQTMSFGLAGLCSLIDPIELDDEMLNLTSISERDTAQVEDSTRLPSFEFLQRDDIQAVLFFCQLQEALVFRRKFGEIR